MVCFPKISFEIGMADRSVAYDVKLAAAVMDGHVAAFSSVFAIGEELVHEVGESETTLLENSSLSILTESDIFWDQRRSRAYRYTLLTS